MSTIKEAVDGLSKIADKQLDDYFANMELKHLMQQTQGALNEYAEIVRKRVFRDNDIFLFVEEILGYNLEDHHAQILASQQNTKQAHKQLTLAFRGCGKSTIGTVARVVYEIIKDPNTRILLASNTQIQAEVFAREIKEHFEGNEKLINIFGDYVGKKWDSKEIVVSKRNRNLKESTMTCIGVGGPTASRHYDLVICCHPDTEVMSRKGMLPIKDIKVGTKVLSHDGKYHKVTQAHTRPYEGPLFGITPYKSCETVWVTPNHPVLVKRFNPDGLPEVKYIPASQVLKTDYLPYPKVNHDSPHKISSRKDINDLLKVPEFWSWLGYWYAEGSVDQAYRRVRLTFGVNEKEQEYIKDCQNCMEVVFGVRPKAVLSNGGTVTQLSLNDSRFEFLRDCGRLSHEKYLPYWVKQAHFPRLKRLLQSYWRGDGHCTQYIKQNGLQVGFVSVSKTLLADVRQCLLDYNISTSLRLLRPEDPAMEVCGNIVSAKPTYALLGDVSLSDFIGLDEEVDFESYQPSSYYFDKKFYYSSIKDIKTTEYKGDVYNLEVDEAHTYCHDLMTSHNCDDIVDEENSRTELQRDKVFTWFYKSLMPTLEPHARLFVSGTCYNPGDLYSILRKDPSTNQCIVPALNEHGESAWPDKFSTDYLVKIREEMGIPIFETQFQMNTAAMEGKIFNYDSFHFYEELPKGLVKFQGVDLAIGQNKENDYYSNATIGVCYDGPKVRRYVIAVHRSRKRFRAQTADIVKRFFLQDALKVGIEANAYQAAQVHEVQEHIGKRKAIPIYTLKDKTTRGMKLAAKCEDAELLFNKKDPMQMLLIEELIKMPGGDHDDMFDALDLAVTTSVQGIRKKRSNEPGIL